MHRKYNGNDLLNTLISLYEDIRYTIDAPVSKYSLLLDLNKTADNDGICLKMGIIKTFWKVNESTSKIEAKARNVSVTCLAFADDLALMANSGRETISQIEDLKSLLRKLI